jgi:hypothetical protein
MPADYLLAVRNRICLTLYKPNNHQLKAVNMPPRLSPLKSTMFAGADSQLKTNECKKKVNKL